MSRLRRAVLRLYNLVRPAPADRQLEREIAAHLAFLEEDFRRRGLEPGEAALAAKRAMGGVQRVKEEHRDARSFPWLEDARRDARYALRSLSRSSSFSVVAILTLALGIGANTAIFSAVHAVLLSPLSHEDATRLVRLVENVPSAGSPDRPPTRRGVNLTVAELIEIRRARTIAAASISTLSFMTVAGGTETARLEGVRVSAASFEMRGVAPLVGRIFDVRDEAAGADPVIILSHGTWRRYLGADPNVVGRVLTLEDVFARESSKAYTVVGVMPGTFDENEQNQFWIPFSQTAAAGRGAPRGNLVARLAADRSAKAAEAEIGGILGRLRAAQGPTVVTPATGPPRYQIVPARDEPAVRPALLVLMAAAGIVLLVACVNVASVVLARTAARQQELSLRLAIGASRSRIVRQLLTESVLLALVGGVGGAALAFGGVRLLRTLAGTLSRMDLGVQLSFPRLNQISVNTPVLAFAVVVSIAAGVLVGVAPAVWVTRARRRHALNERMAFDGAGFGAREGLRVRGLLVVTEIAMATILLVGGLLLIQSFVKLAGVDAGYDPAHVLTFQVAVPSDRYPAGRLGDLAEAVSLRVRAVPGVTESAYARQLPLVAIRESAWFRRTPGLSDPPPQQPDGAPDARLVSQDYFKVLGIPIVSGRAFGEDDGPGRPRVLLVNQALARREFPGENALGQTVYAGRDAEPWTIVGVTADVRQFGLDQAPQPQFFADFRQWPRSDPSAFTFLGPYYAVRTIGDPSSVVAGVRSAIREVDDTAGVYNVASMEQLVANSVSRARMYAALLGLFAGIAALMAAMGIYGVMAYTVAQRTREIGIRMALGAQRADVVALVMRQSLGLAVAGLVVGVAGAAAFSRQLQGMLFGVTPLDSATYLGVPIAFGVVAAFAAYLPARRATLVDPMVALRRE